jgi:transposase
MNANLIHKWLKDPRFAPEPEIDEQVLDTGFLPVEIEGPVAFPVVDDQPKPGDAVSAQRVDITLSDGRRILVEGPTALSGVLTLVEGLMV